MVYWVLQLFHSFAFKMSYFTLLYPGTGYAVAQLVEALRYKPEGRGFDARWCHWNFSFDIITA
jgi:hypothetical protein